MPTNLAIDDDLLSRAQRIGGLKTKRETVNRALQEFIDRRRQRHILRNLGTVSFREDWDYKRGRARRAPHR